MALLKGRVHFAVEDPGSGIAEAELSKLFSAFVQTESGANSKEGTGLGLTIFAQLIRLMGGEIRVRSRVNEGGVFSFEIPLAKTDDTTEAQTGRRVAGIAPGQPPVRILVVDDTEDNRLLLKQVLGATGLVVQEASDGEQATSRFERFGPALVLMDARMKGVDGRETTRRIREREGVHGTHRCAIIALTAGAFEHEREEMLKAGAANFVAKPFRIETDLREAAGLSRSGLHLRRARDPQGEPRTGAGAPHARAPGRVVRRASPRPS